MLDDWAAVEADGTLKDLASLSEAPESFVVDVVVVINRVQ